MPAIVSYFDFLPGVATVMADYERLDFPSWSKQAELTDNVAEVIDPDTLPPQPAGTLAQPGYIFRDGKHGSPRSFIISTPDRKWWTILWTGETVQADNLLDVAIDIWQSRQREILLYQDG